MQAVLDQNILVKDRPDGRAARTAKRGRKMSLAAKIFGCWHGKLSRPFHERDAAYRACLDCGARRAFDADNFRTFGPYYYAS